MARVPNVGKEILALGIMIANLTSLWWLSISSCCIDPAKSASLKPLATHGLFISSIKTTAPQTGSDAWHHWHL
jgi:hypothetical protein